MKYRIYASGTIINEDDFAEWDNSLPLYDDYSEHDVNDEIEAHILEESKEKYKKLEKKLDILESKFYDLEEENEDLETVLEKIRNTIKGY